MRVIKGFILISIQFLFTLNSNCQISDLNEREISQIIQSLIGGEREVTVTNGRVDLLLDSIAFEIEKADNWKESIGQALWYGLQTNKKPGIILILKKDSDYKHYIQLNTALDYAGLSDRFKVYLFPNDFLDLLEK